MLIVVCLVIIPKFSRKLLLLFTHRENKDGQSFDVTTSMIRLTLFYKIES